MANNRHLVPNANLNSLKQEAANEVGVNLQAYNGDITARQAGAIGGHMVKKLIQQAEQNLGRF